MAESEKSKLREANDIIRNHAIGAAGVGLIPIPLVDIPVLIGVQVNLVRRLSNLYGLPFSESRGKSVVSALIGSALPMSVMGTMKAIPFVAIAGSSAVAAAATYALGKIFLQHFESGGTILDFDPQKVRAYYAEELRKHHAGPRGEHDEEEDDYGGIMP